MVTYFQDVYLDGSEFFSNYLKYLGFAVKNHFYLKYKYYTSVKPESKLI